MKNKKLLLIFLGIIILILISFFLLIILNKKESFQDISQKETFMEKVSFEEREDIIASILIEKFKVSEGNISVFIARESFTHINGIFFIENSNNEEIFEGSFFATVSDSINIVWADQGAINCQIIIQNNFPQEMAPSCF